MNPIEIAYFKHFMLDKSEHMKFLNLYRQRRLDKNPESIEAYFLKTTVQDVIMKAFAFKIKNIVGVRNRDTYDYWKEVDNAWQQYWPLMENNHSNERWWDLKATFAILRQNWDKHDFYLKENMESVEDTFKRLGAERPTPKVEPKFNVGDKIVNLNSGRVFEILKLAETSYITFDGDAIKYEFQDQFELVPEEDNSLDDYNGNEEDPLADFDFFDSPVCVSSKFKDDEVSLNFNNNSWKITFNIYATDIMSKAGVEFARLAKKENEKL